MGLVMGLEVSRLARNSTDWHRLLEICALAETLILDEDGIYDPSHFNDRLLLGLKGTMSEAELHVLRARLLGGQLNKARRGELWMRPPIGFLADRDRAPDARPGCADPGHGAAALRDLSPDGLALNKSSATSRATAFSGPAACTTGGRAGEIVFAPLEHSRVLGMLHNPRYAGAFVYGRTRQRKVWHRRPDAVPAPGAGGLESLPAQRHPGYVTLGGVRDQSGHAARQCGRLWD